MLRFVGLGRRKQDLGCRMGVGERSVQENKAQSPRVKAL